jgi:hypothetical protein
MFVLTVSIYKIPYGYQLLKFNKLFMLQPLYLLILPRLLALHNILAEQSFKFCRTIPSASVGTSLCAKF